MMGIFETVNLNTARLGSSVCQGCKHARELS